VIVALASGARLFKVTMLVPRLNAAAPAPVIGPIVTEVSVALPVFSTIIGNVSEIAPPGYLITGKFRTPSNTPSRLKVGVARAAGATASRFCAVALTAKAARPNADSIIERIINPVFDDERSVVLIIENQSPDSRNRRRSTQCATASFYRFTITFTAKRYSEGAVFTETIRLSTAMAGIVDIYVT
jgi:hypothetical protein